MKFTLAAILASAPAVLGGRGLARTPDGVLQEGATCFVTWKTNTPGTKDAHYEDYDEHADGSGLCDQAAGLDCNFQIAIDGTELDETPIAGTCEPTACMGSNDRKPSETGSHRITICHRTCSPTNPWVRITIDDDAWAGNSTCGHGIQHDIEDDCNRGDYSAWGGEHTHDHVIRDHGTRGAGSREYVNHLNEWPDNGEEERAYWKKWEKACPAVRNGACCDAAAGECCGVAGTTTTTTAPPPDTTTAPPPDTTTAPPPDTTTAPPPDTTTAPPPDTTTAPPPDTTTAPPPDTTTAPPPDTTTATTADTTTAATTTVPTIPGGGGGDPHFQRWGQEHDSFHGECDLVMVHSEQFHDGAGFDLQARTTIQDYFSYIETMAMKIGDYKLEFHNDHFFLNDVQYTPADLPLTFGDNKYTVENAVVEHGKNANYYQYYKVDLHESSSVIFKFYKKFLTFEINGHPNDFSDAVGLMGEFHTGDMIGRDGRMMQNFGEYGFEWQVNTADNAIFRDARSPQLPYEKCRMPSNDRPARRKLRANNSALTREALEACAHVSGNGLDLCVDDVLQTGDIGLASLW